MCTHWPNQVVSNREAIAVNQAWAGFAGDMLNASLYPPKNASLRNVTDVPSLSVGDEHSLQNDTSCPL